MIVHHSVTNHQAPGHNVGKDAEGMESVKEGGDYTTMTPTSNQTISGAQQSSASMSSQSSNGISVPLSTSQQTQQEDSLKSNKNREKQSSLEPANLSQSPEGFSGESNWKRDLRLSLLSLKIFLRDSVQFNFPLVLLIRIFVYLTLETASTTSSAKDNDSFSTALEHLLTVRRLSRMWECIFTCILGVFMVSWTLIGRITIMRCGVSILRSFVIPLSITYLVTVSMAPSTALHQSIRYRYWHHVWIKGLGVFIMATFVAYVGTFGMKKRLSFAFAVITGLFAAFYISVVTFMVDFSFWATMNVESMEGQLLITCALWPALELIATKGFDILVVPQFAQELRRKRKRRAMIEQGLLPPSPQKVTVLAPKIKLFSGGHKSATILPTTAPIAGMAGIESIPETPVAEEPAKNGTVPGGRTSVVYSTSQDDGKQGREERDLLAMMGTAKRFQELFLCIPNWFLIFCQSTGKMITSIVINMIVETLLRIALAKYLYRNHRRGGVKAGKESDNAGHITNKPSVTTIKLANASNHRTSSQRVLWSNIDKKQLLKCLHVNKALGEMMAIPISAVLIVTLSFQWLSFLNEFPMQKQQVMTSDKDTLIKLWSSQPSSVVEEKTTESIAIHLFLENFFGSVSDLFGESEPRMATICAYVVICVILACALEMFIDYLGLRIDEYFWKQHQMFKEKNSPCSHEIPPQRLEANSGLASSEENCNSTIKNRSTSTLKLPATHSLSGSPPLSLSLNGNVRTSEVINEEEKREMEDLRLPLRNRLTVAAWACCMSPIIIAAVDNASTNIF